MYRHRFLKIFSIVVMLFLFIPLILIMLTAFNSSDTISLPLEGFTLSWFQKVFKSRSLTSAFKTSFSLSVKATVLAVIIGTFSSIAIVKRKSKVSDFLLNLFLSPSLIPGIVIGYVLFQCMVVRFAIPLDTALLLGHILIVLPYSARLMTAALRGLDSSIEEAAMTLGCTAPSAFMRVVLPELKGAMISSFMLGFVNSFNNVPVSMFLKAPGKNTLPYAMMSYIEYTYDPTVSALSVMLMAMTVLFMFLMDAATGKKAK